MMCLRNGSATFLQHIRRIFNDLTFHSCNPCAISRLPPGRRKRAHFLYPRGHTAVSYGTHHPQTCHTYVTPAELSQRVTCQPCEAKCRDFPGMGAGIQGKWDIVTLVPYHRSAVTRGVFVVHASACLMPAPREFHRRSGIPKGWGWAMEGCTISLRLWHAAGAATGRGVRSARFCVPHACTSRISPAFGIPTEWGRAMEGCTISLHWWHAAGAATGRGVRSARFSVPHACTSRISPALRNSQGMGAAMEGCTISLRLWHAAGAATGRHTAGAV